MQFDAGAYGGRSVAGVLPCYRKTTIGIGCNAGLRLVASNGVVDRDYPAQRGAGSIKDLSLEIRVKCLVVIDLPYHNELVVLQRSYLGRIRSSHLVAVRNLDRQAAWGVGVCIELQLKDVRAHGAVEAPNGC